MPTAHLVRWSLHTAPRPTRSCSVAEPASFSNQSNMSGGRFPNVVNSIRQLTTTTSHSLEKKKSSYSLWGEPMVSLNRKHKGNEDVGVLLRVTEDTSQPLS